MKKNQIRIGDLSKELCIEKFVIRFWEKEFKIKSRRSSGQQRFYTTHDVELFHHIKKLLYAEGFTIAGAKKQLEDEKANKKSLHASTKTTLETNAPEKKELNDRITSVYQQLIKLRELL